MLSMLIFAAAAAPAPVIIVDARDAPRPGFRCAARDGVRTVENGQKTLPRAQALNELPNANEYKAVLRRDEYGCQKPLIVNYNIGSAPRK
jgi:hypothetical protein